MASLAELFMSELPPKLDVLMKAFSKDQMRDQLREILQLHITNWSKATKKARVKLHVLCFALFFVWSCLLLGSLHEDHRRLAATRAEVQALAG